MNQKILSSFCARAATLTLTVGMLLCAQGTELALPYDNAGLLKAKAQVSQRKFSPEFARTLRVAFRLSNQYAQLLIFRSLGLPADSPLYRRVERTILKYSSELKVQAPQFEASPEEFSGKADDYEAVLIQIGNQSAKRVAFALNARYGASAGSIYTFGWLANSIGWFIGPEPEMRAVLSNVKDVLVENGSVIGMPQRTIEKFFESLQYGDFDAFFRATDFLKKEVDRGIDANTSLTKELARHRRNAMKLGWDLGLTALGLARQEGYEPGESMFAKSRTLAKELGVRLHRPRERTGDLPRDIAEAIKYLRFDAGPAIARELRLWYGLETSNLFQLGLRMTWTMELYSPSYEPSFENIRQDLIIALNRDAQGSSLPPELWSSVISAMEQGEPRNTVISKMKAASDRIRNYLDNVYENL